MNRYEITTDDISFCDAYTTKLCKRCGRMPDEDALQSGRLGLCEAANLYEPEKGTFKGWSTYYIKKQIFRHHYHMQSGDALNQPDKNVAEFEDFRHSIPSHEKQVIDRDLVVKVLQRATPKQRVVLLNMFYNDMNPYDMAREFGKTHQSYDRLFQNARKRITTLKMRKEITG